MKFSKIDRNYISEVDKVLAAIDEKFATPSLSQQLEIDKHARIHRMRDQPDKCAEETKNDLWDGF